MRHAWRSLLALGLLGAAVAFTVSGLELDYRLDAFLPAPKTTQQQIVVDQVAGGQAGRLILAAVDGEDSTSLAQTSRALAEAWRGVDGVARVDNGDWSESDPLIEALMRHRFVLVDDVANRVEPDAMATALDDRLADLSLAGRRVETLIRRDPLGLVQDLGERLGSAGRARLTQGVWFDESDRRALLLIESTHPPYAVEPQSRLLEQLRARFAEAAEPDQQLTLAGAPIIAVASARASREDAMRLSLWGSAVVLLVLAFAWRSVSAMLAGAVPLLFGVLCGLGLTVLAFGQIHGLTLAFGFTLLGVALDYPVHLFGHADRRALAATARNIRAPLLLGVTSTLIAYATIWITGSTGLAQLGAFSAAGLAGAAVATLLLPALDPALPRRVEPTRIEPVHWPAVPIMLGLAALGFLVWQGEARWSNDLSRLSPIDPQQVSADRDLRQAVGGGDVRYLIVAEAATRETALQASEATVRQLEAARRQGLIDDWQAPTELLPSARTQNERLARWPSADVLRERIAAADAGFSEGAFDPFFADLAAARERGPISADVWAGTPLSTRLNAQLRESETGWRALISPVGLDAPDRLGDYLESRGAPAELVDLAAGSEAMVVAWRRDAGFSLGIAGSLILVLLSLRMQGLRDTLAVALPPVAAVLVTAAAMSVLDQGLTIVHLIALLLTAGIGLDFAVFSRSFRHDPPAAARSRRSINTCALSTGGVFLVLGQSTIGMLQMLGLTVALGILLSWLFSRIGQPG